MHTHFRYGWLGFACLALLAALGDSRQLQAEQKPLIAFRVLREGDKATLQDAEVRDGAIVLDDSATLLIDSATGIGEIELERVGAAWPRRIALHIDLAALEGLRLKTSLGAWEWSLGIGEQAASARGLGDSSVTLTKIGERMIRIDLPAEALGEARQAHILWIDFYRR